MQAEKEQAAAFAIASGRRIYVYDQTQFDCLYTAKRPINDLAIYGSGLVYSGGEDGVRDAITGQVVTGALTRWNKIGVSKGVLFGAINTEDPAKFGIWNVDQRKITYCRTGRTDGFLEKPFLMDWGSYPDQIGKRHVLLETASGKEISAFIGRPITAATMDSGKSLFLADRAFLFQRPLDYSLSNLRQGYSYHRIHSPWANLFQSFEGLVNQQFDSARSLKRGWDEFVTSVVQVSEWEGVPKDQLVALERCGFHRRPHSTLFSPMPFKSAIEWYWRSFCPQNKQDYAEIKSVVLEAFIQNLYWSLVERYHQENSVRALATLGPDHYLVGLSSGVLLGLEEWDTVQTGWGTEKIYAERQIHKFKSPMTAIKEIPEDILGGIRARLKDKKDAKFASIATQKKPVFLRKVA